MKSIKRNFLYNILLNISSVVFPLITAPYTSRVLEPDGIGLINFSGSYAGYFTLVALLGIPNYGVREVSKLRDNKEGLTQLVSQLMSISAIVTVGVSIIYLLTILFIDQFNENFIVFFITGFAIYLAPIKINWFFQGLEEFGYITLRSFVVRVFSIVCLFLFVHEKDDLIIWILISLLGNSVADIWNYTKMMKMGVHPKFTVKGLKPHIKPLFILFSSVIAISIYTLLDTLMLGFITNYSEVGYYNQAVHLSKTIVIAVTSLSVVAIPRVSYYYKEKEYDKINELFNKSFTFVSFISFPTAIFLMCISSTFVPLFFGSLFGGAVLPLIILSTLIIFIGLNNLAGMQILMGLGFDKLFLYSVSLGTFLNFTLNCVFIPIYGAIGASIASAVAEASVLFIMLFYVYKNTPIRVNNYKNLVGAICGSFLLLPLCFIIHYFLSGWLYILTFALLGGVLYMIFEYYIKNESVILVLTTTLNVIKKYKGDAGKEE